MKVIYVTILFYPAIGGAETLALNLGMSITDRGHEVIILNGRFCRDDPRREIKDGIPIERHASYGIRDAGGNLRLSTYTYMASLAWFLIRNRNRYDAIHCFMCMQNAFVSGIVGRLLRKPVVVQLGSSGDLFDPIVLSQRRFGKYMVGRIFGDASAVIAPNKTAMKQALEFGCGPEKLFLIPNGSRMVTRGTTSSTVGLRKRYSIPEKAVVFLFVGSFNEIKGIPTLMRAWAGAASKVKMIHLIMIGDGPLMRELHEFFASRGIDQTVTMTGRIPSIDNYLLLSDCFILPSQTEGISLALIEAMGAGLVPIVSANEGNLETIGLASITSKGPVVTDYGVAFSVDDVSGLSASIRRLAGDGSLRDTISNNVARRARQCYDVSMLAQRYEEIYGTLLSKRGVNLLNGD